MQLINWCYSHNDYTIIVNVSRMIVARCFNIILKELLLIILNYTRVIILSNMPYVLPIEYIFKSIRNEVEYYSYFTMTFFVSVCKAFITVNSGDRI